MITADERAALTSCIAHLGKLEGVDGSLSYLASSALCDFLGGVKAGYHMLRSGDHHWVVSDYGTVLDPTKDRLNGDRPPYRHGQKVQKRNNLNKHLPLLEAMRADLVGTEESAEPVRDIVGRPLVLAKEAVLSDEQQQLLSDAWTVLIGNWAADPEEFIRTHFPKGALAVQFVRALLYGEEIPRYATMAYTWDRYYVAGSSRPFNEMLPGALEDPRILRGIRFGLADELSFRKLIASGMPVLGYRMPFDFPISLAHELIDKYCPAGGAVLDPCHGWGGRLVGFMLSQASSYVGIDPAPHSYKLREMFDDLSKYLPVPKSLKLINKPFEDVGLKQDFYDFSFTSPPYYNTEKYLGEQSSWRRYKSLDDWIDGFYRELIVGVSDALKPGAYFALQVTPKFQMLQVAKDIGQEVGLVYLKAFDTTMKRYNSVSADKDGSTDSYEIVGIFRKKE